MKLQTDLSSSIKPEWTMDKEKALQQSKEEITEEALAKVFSEEKPKLTVKIAEVAKTTAVTLWEIKKDTCCLLPQNSPLLSDRCVLSKLPGLRQIKQKFRPRQTKA